nr:hypothetical protein [Ferrovum sp.]
MAGVRKGVSRFFLGPCACSACSGISLDPANKSPTGPPPSSVDGYGREAVGDFPKTGSPDPQYAAGVFRAQTEHFYVKVFVFDLDLH